jgi:hypothetical protein
MSLLKFIEKDPRVKQMEELHERLEGEPARQWAYIKSKDNANKRSRSK